MEEQAKNLVRQILQSQTFRYQNTIEQQAILDQILLTGEITQEELVNLLNETLQEEQNNLQINPAIQQLSKNLESLDFNSFLNVIRQGDIQGKDLLALCNVSSKLREYCHRSFELRDNQGAVIQTIPNYLFTSLLSDKGIRVLPGQNAKEIYKQKIIGGQVWSFGGNWHRQLGLGDNKNRFDITLNHTLNNIVQISAGTYHSFCLDNEGYVWAFGSNSSGELGLGDTTNRAIPTLIPNFNNIIQVCAGYSHSLCLDNQGRVWAFGTNGSGQLGLGDDDDRYSPTLIPNLNNIVQVSIGNYHSLCLDNQGRVWGFGNNAGELGLGDEQDRNIPTLIPNLTNIIQVKARGMNSLCLDNQGRVWSFGDNDNGQLGLGDNHQQLIPALIPNLINIIQISISNYHSLCLDNQGRVWGFGNNNFGQSGPLVPRAVNVDLVYISPTIIPSLNDIIEVSVGDYHSICLDSQGRIWSFGHGEYGELGLGDNQDRNTPSLIPNLTGVFQISAGSDYSLILKF